MKNFVYVVNRQAVNADFIPASLDLILFRRAVSEDDNGRFLCDPDAPAGDRGTYFKNRMFAFFGTRGAALQYLAQLANRTIGELEAQRGKAVDFSELIYDVMDAEGLHYDNPTRPRPRRKNAFVGS